MHGSHASSLREALANTRERLLAARDENGCWTGELSTSALSTATAAFALALYERDAAGPSSLVPLVRGGIDWLVRHQNEDGGWGDTTRSISNISTTALCWAALSLGGAEVAPAVERAEGWLRRSAGSLEPGTVAGAITRRYGRDRTFSVPILTMCALAGLLGKGQAAWGQIPGLPFELAACPPQWFQHLRLPVVSYALPALIAMGHVGHRHRPARNPAVRLTRDLARGRTLRVLESIQPEGGGFLEATPLTSFVVMSLIASGEAAHPVVTRGIDFLVRSVRPDGSWPIDTNLATWLTTLSVNALAAGDSDPGLTPPERDRIRKWLVGQQYREVHPYTQAAPGGWAWTDLPGGVPDADDTAGALLALWRLGEPEEALRGAAASGVRWLLDLQNRDGGVPTFCRGWGALPFDRSGADLTAHAIIAWSAWREQLPALSAAIDRGIERGLRYLAATQRQDGSWVPLWFGSQHVPEDENPCYGTARVLPALLAAGGVGEPMRERVRRGVAWLLRAQHVDGGWGGDRGIAPSIEETALAVHALALAAERGALEDSAAIQRGVSWLIEATDGGRRFEASPIGFYFARLWYYEREYPLIFTAAALAQARRQLEDRE